MNTLKAEYQQDFYSWIHQNIELLKQGKLADIDIEILIDELESMARRDKRELTSRLMILIAHLPKWQFQPENQSGSWRGSIREQRIQLIEQLEESLSNSLDESVIKAYPKTLALAVDATGLSSKQFPPECPYTLQQLLDENFYPAM